MRSYPVHSSPAAHRTWVGRLLVSSVLLLGWAGSATAQTGCSESSPAITALPQTLVGENPDLADLGRDCATLLVRKDDLMGSGQYVWRLNWAEDVSMDTWDGITVGGSPPRVTALNLYHPDNKLAGVIPETLFRLRELRVLSLHSNKLTGEIHQTLSFLSSLEILSLHSNQLTGPIPSYLANLDNLRVLSLYDTNWTGEIPQALKDKPGLLLQTNRRPTPTSAAPPILRVGEERPYEVFTDRDGDALACDATRADGSAFPRWLGVHESGCTLTLRAAATAAVCELEVKVIATDTPQDQSPPLKTLTTFTLTLEGSNGESGAGTDCPSTTGATPGNNPGGNNPGGNNPGGNNPGGNNPGGNNPGGNNPGGNNPGGNNPGGNNPGGNPGGGPGGDDPQDDDPQDDDSTAAEPTGFLENPGPNSFRSGIGLISGWVCEADEVEIEIETESGAVRRERAAYGTERLDTLAACGDTDNGFGLLFNWNRLGDGEHTVVASVDGMELGRATVMVTTLDEEFLRDVAGECLVADFPLPGETVTLEWQETQQNFVIASDPRPDGANLAGVAGEGYLENPGPDSFQSGIGLISGWVCEAEGVEIETETESGGTERQVAAYGTARLDTETACGDTDNGFGLLFNWNRLGDGEHRVVALVDGVELGWATVRVTTVGAGAEEEFLRDVVGECVLEDFPMVGQTVALEWQEAAQNFIIAELHGASDSARTQDAEPPDASRQGSGNGRGGEPPRGSSGPPNSAPPEQGPPPDPDPVDS